jgi:hypothetical protein
LRVDDRRPCFRHRRPPCKSRRFFTSRRPCTSGAAVILVRGGMGDVVLRKRGSRVGVPGPGVITPLPESGTDIFAQAFLLSFALNPRRWLSGCTSPLESNDPEGRTTRRRPTRKSRSHPASSYLRLLQGEGERLAEGDRDRLCAHGPPEPGGQPGGLRGKAPRPAQHNVSTCRPLRFRTLPAQKPSSRGEP